MHVCKKKYYFISKCSGIKDGKILYRFGTPWGSTPNEVNFESFLENGVGNRETIIPKFLTV